MNVIQEIIRINEKELEQGLTNTPASWHAKYSSSAWIYIGNLPIQLTEGDVIAVVSQFGEVEDINLVREEGTGKSKGFCFVKYEDCRSCVLAVDNFNGSKVLGRSLRVDHVENYRLPKHLREKEEGKEDMEDSGQGNERIGEDGELVAGHAYKGKALANEYNISQGQDLFAQPTQNLDNMDNTSTSEQERKEAKLQRKAERDRIRKEREARKEEREEKRRLKRAKALEKNDKEKDRKQKKKKDSKRKRRSHNKEDEARRHDSFEESDSSVSRENSSRKRLKKRERLDSE
ncbi:hypothetical protein CTEN210_10694 [Chaetoceros tenuissimus]|uniref:RRM domain-containing protein n=1 Tax=Chaetoceros tenuissimus TaxID=426638 RepID=A0AAD3CXX6_9STRA|nr:hypothetical protein CTEN210_10694 [Chaetoceros tenuissimus]